MLVRTELVDSPIVDRYNFFSYMETTIANRASFVFHSFTH
jgi:hypothetical protein